MRYRRDYVTNSSSSSYIIYSVKDREEFIDRYLDRIVKDRYSIESESKFTDFLSKEQLRFVNRKLKELLNDELKRISKRRAFIIYYNYKKKEDKDKLMEIFDNLEDNNFYLTREYEDKYSEIEQELDFNEVFDYDKLADNSEVKIFYMNHHWKIFL